MENNSTMIWILYPFTSGAIGADDDYVIRSNTTNAFFIALRKVREETSKVIKAIYLTDQRTSYEIESEGIVFQFLPGTHNPGQGHANFGNHWSFDMASKLVMGRPLLVFLFIGGGWFAIFLAVICRALSIPYCPIIAGWGTSTRRSQKWFYKNALHVIVHTNAHKELFQKAGVDTANFLVMPMGVDTDLFLMKSKNRNNLRVQPVRFLHAGRIEQRKNLLGALKIFKSVREKYPDACFDIIGPASNPDYYQQVLAFIQDNHLKDHVFFQGFVPNAIMPEYYARADLMLFPTLSESFGFVIAESMACGTPVAALRGRGSPDEIIEDGVDGLLAQHEAELVDKILETLRVPGRLEAMGHSARQKVERYYSANQTFEQLKGLLNEVGLKKE